jgi:hypothetical protein
VSFDCLGFLFETHGIGNGMALFCPAFPVSSGDTADAYSNPLFMSTSGGGTVYGTMLFNPRELDATNGVVGRAFPKTSSTWSEPGSGGQHLFGLDNLAILDAPSSFTPDSFSHYPAQGFDCLFTDGSVKFVQSVPAFQFVSGGGIPGSGPNSPDNESNPVRIDYDHVYNWLENGD